MIDIVIHGFAGRMGRSVAAAALESDDFRVVGGVSASRPDAGLAGWPDAKTAASLADLNVVFDVLIDFSSPAGAAVAAEYARSAGKPFVTGTTGLEASQEKSLKSAATEVPVVAAPNFSVGVTLLMDLVERVTRGAGPDADVEILEAHHRHKIDAPSGTALRLGEAVAAQRGEPLERLACYDRRSEEGARAPGSIGFASQRGGDIIGEHQVLFALSGERIELGHRASDRGIFARGALRAAHWTTGRPPGLYGMKDVLDL
jgi:4-hydroxy-tetrahydrodipicolinate reductase